MSFITLRQSSRFNKNSNVSNITDILPKTPLLAYDLNDIDDNQLPAGRSVIAKLCRTGNIIDNPDDNLHTICTIYTLLSILSGLDTDALSNQWRSWIVELMTVGNELAQQRNYDLGAVRQSLEGLAPKAKGIEGHDWALETYLWWLWSACTLMLRSPLNILVFKDFLDHPIVLIPWQTGPIYS